MLAAQRATVARHEIRDLLGDRHHLGAPRSVVNLHQRADVQAAHARVRVVGGLGAMPFHDRSESVHERGELRRVHGGVFHERHRLALARHAVQERLPRLAQLPRVRERLRVLVALHRHARQGRRESIEARAHGFHRVALELDIHHRAQTAAGRLRKHLDITPILGVGERRLDHHVVHELHRARPAADHPHQRRQGRGHALEAQDRESRAGGLGHQLQRRGRDRRQRALAAAHQRGQVHAIEGARRASVELIQQQVEVVAVDMTLDGGDASPDLLAQRQRDRRQSLRHRALTRIPLARTLAEVHRGAVRHHHLEREEILHRPPMQDASRARRVVADHAAERGVSARRDIRTEEESLGRQRRVQLIQRDARLHARRARRRVDLEDRPAMRAEVHHHREVHTLARQTGAATAWQHRKVVRLAEPHQVRDPRRRPRHDHPDRLHLVDARVGRVEHPVVTIEADLAHAERAKFVGHAQARGLGMRQHIQVHAHRAILGLLRHRACALVRGRFSPSSTPARLRSPSSGPRPAKARAPCARRRRCRPGRSRP